MATKESIPGRTMDQAWRDAISEGLKASDKIQHNLVDSVSAAKDGLIASAKKLNQKAVGIRDNVIKGIKDTPLSTRTTQSIDQFKRHAPVVSKFTVKDAATSVGNKIKEVNQKAIGVRDNVVSKVKAVNQSAVSVRDNVKEVVRSNVAKAVKSMPDMSNGGKGQQFNVPKSGQNVADAQKALDTKNSLNNMKARRAKL